MTVIVSRRAYDNPQTLFAKQETWRGVRVLRVRSTGFGKGAKWRRALDCASFTVSCCLRALRLSRHDTVLALTSPPLISLVGLCLAQLWRCRFYYWVMDLNPDEAIAAGWLQAGSRAAGILEWASRLSLKNADQVFALDRFMAERILQKAIPPERICILPPWSHDPEVQFDDEGRNRFRSANGLANKFVVMYSGNHSPCHPLDMLIDAALRLAGQHDVVFCFIGGGSEFRRIRHLFVQDSDGRNSKTENWISSNILCLPYQPLDELSVSLSAADLHIVIHGNDFVGVVHPCKIYNILRLGIPLVYIGPDSGPIPDILTELNGHVLSASIRHGDVEGLLRRIEELRSCPRGRPPTSHAHFASRFSKGNILSRFIAQLEGNLPTKSGIEPEAQRGNGLRAKHREETVLVKKRLR